LHGAGSGCKLYQNFIWRIDEPSQERLELRVEKDQPGEARLRTGFGIKTSRNQQSLARVTSRIRFLALRLKAGNATPGELERLP
jgi:hypothetical protein